MKKINYNPIADGLYVREHRLMLKDMCVWPQMTKEEKEFFKPCIKCKAYDEYLKNHDEIARPCDACEHHKTEVQVDIKMATLRKKY